MCKVIDLGSLITLFCRLGRVPIWTRWILIFERLLKVVKSLIFWCENQEGILWLSHTNFWEILWFWSNNNKRKRKILWKIETNDKVIMSSGKWKIINVRFCSENYSKNKEMINVWLTVRLTTFHRFHSFIPIFSIDQCLSVYRPYNAVKTRLTMQIGTITVISGY